MNRYCQQFLDADFSSHRLERKMDTSLDLFHSDLPAVQVPGLDTDLLDEIYHACTSNPQEFRPLHTSVIGKDWYFSPRTSGWTEICVKYEAASHRILSLHTNDEAKDQISPTLTQNQTILQACQRFFDHNGIQTIDTFVLSLAPDGWIGPHIDKKNVDPGLTYFWMPLHDFAGPVMKVFPWGWLRHQFGSLYLFNHCRYVHAVCNSTAVPRMVMTGRMRSDTVPDWVIQQFSRSNNDSAWEALWYD